MEIGKNNRIEQTPIHDLNLPANPHGYWLFGSSDFQSENMISSQPRYDHFDTAAYKIGPFAPFPAPQRFALRSAAAAFMRRHCVMATRGVYKHTKNHFRNQALEIYLSRVSRVETVLNRLDFLYQSTQVKKF